MEVQMWWGERVSGRAMLRSEGKREARGLTGIGEIPKLRADFAS